jgi:multicomponent K+:H+ antiporter subunit A
MAAGIIDHETGTRDIRRLSGLNKSMPFTARLAMVAAAAMAGVPLLNGFISKEMFFTEALTASTAPTLLHSILPLAATSPASLPSPIRCASSTAPSSARITD